MNPKSSRLTSALANIALVLASGLLTLALCEAGLRLFLPKYAHLADGAFLPDPNLLFVRIPNNRDFRWHPDTGVRHPLIHNDLGLRQHRNFTAVSLDSSVNVGFFGDSFVENVGMPAHFSFTEPLDYLLNMESEDGGGGGSTTTTCSTSAWRVTVPRNLFSVTRRGLSEGS